MHLASFRFFDADGNVCVMKVVGTSVQLLIANVPKIKFYRFTQIIVLSLRVGRVDLQCPFGYSFVL
jgi:hypothetical protein